MALNIKPGVSAKTGNANTQSRSNTGSGWVADDSSQLTNEASVALSNGAFQGRGSAQQESPLVGHVDVLKAGPTVQNRDFSLGNDNFSPTQNVGLNEQRPEILANFDFEPTHEPDKSVTPVGDMLDFQIEARNLKSDNILALIAELKGNDATKDLVERLEMQYGDQLIAARDDVVFLQSIVNLLSRAKRGFNVKQKSLEIQSEIATRRTESRRPAVPLETIMGSLGFSSSGISSFTNTKILAQILEDLKFTIVQFSPTLFPFFGFRRDDVDATRVNAVERISQFRGANDVGINFEVAQLASTSVDDIVASTLLSEHERISNRLPADSVDRMLYISNLLNKEYKVSAGLSVESVRRIIQALVNPLGAQLGINLADTLSAPIPGGALVFEGPDTFQSLLGSLTDVNKTPQGVLAQFLKVRDDGINVLPWEQVRVQTEGGQELLPGSQFYVDSIVRGDTLFDTTSFVRFARDFDEAVGGVETVLEETLEVFNTERDFSSQPQLIGDYFFFAAAIMGHLQLNGLTSKNALDVDNAIGAAILSASADDVTLRYYIWLYLLAVQFAHAETSGEKTDYLKTLEAAGLTEDVLFETVRTKIGLAEQASTTGQSAEVNVAAGSGIFTVYSELFKKTFALETLVEAMAIKIAEHINSRFFGAQGTLNRSALNAPRFTPLPGDADLDGIIDVNFQSIKDTLTNAPSSNPNWILSWINRQMTEFDKVARRSISVRSAQSTSNSDGYFSNSSVGLTKFNFLGAHTLGILAIDLYSTMAKSYISSGFFGQADEQSGAERAVISVDYDNNRAVRQAVQGFMRGQGLTDEALSGVGLEAGALFGSVGTFERTFGELNDIFRKIQRETDIMRNLLDVFVSLRNQLNALSRDVDRFFSDRGPNADQLASFAQRVDATDTLGTISEAQSILSKVELDDFITARDRGEENKSPFIDGSMVQPSVRNALFSMLQQPKFATDKGNNLQILSVGLPAGFIDSLRARLGVFSVGRDFKQFSAQRSLRDDVIRVNVYMQDVMNPEVVFKPQRFIFQTSRFATLSSFPDVIDPSTDFDAVLANSIKTGVVAKTNVNLAFESGQNAATASTYSFLTPTQRLEMLRNHAQSFLLGVYIRSLTGVDMSEESFLLNKDTRLLQIDESSRLEFQTILERHISGLAGRRVTLDQLRAENLVLDKLLKRLDEQQHNAGIVTTLGTVIDDLSEGANIEIGEDILNFMRVFSPNSVLFGAATKRQKIASPKKFERIFNIAVDPDDFEVDEPKMRITTAGVNFRRSSVFSSNVTEEVASGVITKKFNRRTTPVSFLQFFVTIEQLPEKLDTLDETRTDEEPPADEVPPTPPIDPGLLLGGFGAAAG